MNLVFCGTPKFAVPTLNALAQAGHSIQLVLSQPDRPSGRGQHLAIPAVKQRAGELELPLAQPARLKSNRDLQAQLAGLQPDAIVVVAYGRLIPSWMLRLPRLGSFNVHASLLPKYRGAAPVQWAIAKGETTTGVTIIQLDEGMDTGPILLQQEVEIAPDDTSLTLAPRLADLGAQLMMEALEEFASRKIKSTPQDHSRASLAPLLTKQDGLIDFFWSATEIYNRLRGFQPWPGVYTRFRGKQLEITAARPFGEVADRAPGRVILQTDRLLFSCGKETLLEVLELQLEGRKRMSAREFLNGYRPLNDEILGEIQTVS